MHDLVVDAPHDIRGAGEVCLVERRHQELFLLCIVLPEVTERIELLLHAVGISCCKRPVERIEHLLEPRVLELQDRDGVALGKGVRREVQERAFLFGPAVEECGVHVAELLDLRHRHAALDELLLGVGDLLCRDLGEVAHEVGADALEVLALRKAGDEARELLLAFGCGLGALGSSRLRSLGCRFRSGCGSRSLGFSCLLCLLIALDSEAMSLEGADKLVEVDTLDAASLPDCHEFPHRLEHPGLHDLREACCGHKVLDFGMCRARLKDAGIEIYRFCHDPYPFRQRVSIRRGR